MDIWEIKTNTICLRQPLLGATENVLHKRNFMSVNFRSNAKCMQACRTGDLFRFFLALSRKTVFTLILVEHHILSNNKEASRRPKLTLNGFSLGENVLAQVLFLDSHFLSHDL